MVSPADLPTNPDAYFPGHIGYISQNSEMRWENDMYLQDLAYAKLRNLTYKAGGSANANAVC